LTPHPSTGATAGCYDGCPFPSPPPRMRRVDGSPIAVKALRDHVDTRTQLKELKAVARVRELKRLKRRGRRAAKKRRR